MNSQSLVSAVKQVGVAFSKFFKENTGFSRFKSKKDPHRAFAVPQRYKVDFANKAVWIPIIGTVKTMFHRVFNGVQKTMTVSRTSTGKYFVSILVDDQQEIPETQPYTEENTIGVDMGIKHFAILSDGEKVENPKYLQKSPKRLNALHKQVASVASAVKCRI